jgi:hypothetical protein
MSHAEPEHSQRVCPECGEPEGHNENCPQALITGDYVWHLDKPTTGKWTIKPINDHYSEIMCGEASIGISRPESAADIVKAHNAALAAERERYAVLKADAAKGFQLRIGAELDRDEARQQLAAEWKLREGVTLREKVTDMKLAAVVEALQVVAENADNCADNYTEVESLRTELRGFAETARAALAKVKRDSDVEIYYDARHETTTDPD